MKKSIEHLKSVIVNGSILKTNNGNIKISRFPNNIIKVYGKSISWKDLQNLLVSSDYELQVKETAPRLFKNETKKKWGGMRVPGPGKTLGANKKDPLLKKKSKTFCLSGRCLQQLEHILEGANTNQNDLITLLIDQAYRKIEKL